MAGQLKTITHVDQIDDLMSTGYAFTCKIGDGCKKPMSLGEIKTVTQDALTTEGIDADVKAFVINDYRRIDITIGRS